MKRNGAFTLVELLVVVLIIGILAAVALPQYQRAVEKSRIAEGSLVVEAIAKANERYRMANGHFTRDINDLDIDYPLSEVNYSGIPARGGENFVFTASNHAGDQRYIALAQRKPSGHRYVLTITLEGTRSCTLYAEASALQRKLCQAWAHER